MTGPRYGNDYDDSRHGEFDALAAGWALHALEPDDEAFFAVHLPTCPRCLREVASLEGTLAELAYAAPSVDPPVGALDRLRAAVAAEADPGGPAPETLPRRGRGAVGIVPVLPASPDPADRSPFDAGRTGDTGGAGRTGDTGGADEVTGTFAPVDGAVPGRESHPGPARPDGPTGAVPELGRRRASGRRPGDGRPASRRSGRRLGWSQAVTALAVVVAMVLGGWNLVLLRDSDRADRLAAQRAETVRTLIQPGTRTARLTDEQGRAVAYVIERDGDLEVVADGLPGNDVATSVYVLWALRGEGDAPTPLGSFDVAGNGFDLRVLGAVPDGLDGVTAFAVSREQGREVPAAPSLPVVASGAVEG